MTYEPGRRLAGDESRRPWVEWVLYADHEGSPDGPLELYAACYVGGALVQRDLVESSIYRLDWARFDFVRLPGKLRVDETTLFRARACWRPGWALWPPQEGLL